MKTFLTQNPSRILARRGFTLIELLVVIAIIALLAGIAVPAFVGSMLTAQQTRASQQAKQIVIGLRAYAADNNGRFPSGETDTGKTITTANDAFRVIIPTYVDAEAIFTVGRSKMGSKADEKMDPNTEILKPGENHYAYVSGLNDTSRSQYPLVADGTKGDGTYSSDENAVGGTWKGQKAVLAHVDGSAVVATLRGAADARYIPRFDDTSKNALAVGDYMGSTVTLLEPAK